MNMAPPKSLRSAWERVKYYPYAGLDFLLDEDMRPVFIEANAVPGGIRVMECVNRMIADTCPSLRHSIIGKHPVSDFVDMCVEYHSAIMGSLPRVAAITSPISGAPLLMPERYSIAREFARRGIEAYIVDRSKYVVIDGSFYVKAGRRLISPDIIVRRNTCFPKKIRQVVINRGEVGMITGSKYRTYRVVRQLLGAHAGGGLRLPRTYFAKGQRQVIRKVKDILERSEIAVVKPNNGEGGRGIFFVRKLEDLKRRLTAFSDGTSFVVQEFVHPASIRFDGEEYLFDVRVYAYMGRLVGCHIRRAPCPVGRGNMELWAISNISRGGRYVPILVGDSTELVRWSRTSRPVPEFQRIIVEKYAMILDRAIIRRIAKATRRIVEAISMSVAYQSDRNAA